MRPVEEYVEAAVHRLLAENALIAEQGIGVLRRDHVLVLTGEVESSARRDEILRLVAENFPDLRIKNDIGVSRTHAPSEAEELT